MDSFTLAVVIGSFFVIVLLGGLVLMDRNAGSSEDRDGSNRKSS